MRSCAPCIARNQDIPARYPPPLLDGKTIDSLIQYFPPASRNSAIPDNSMLSFNKGWRVMTNPPENLKNDDRLYLMFDTDTNTISVEPIPPVPPIPPPPIPPPDPAIITTVFDTVSTIKVTWTTPASELPITGYTIQYRISNVGDWTDIPISASLNEGDITGVISGNTYIIRVLTTSDAGSTPSEEQSINTVTLITVNNSSFDINLSGTTTALTSLNSGIILTVRLPSIQATDINITFDPKPYIYLNINDANNWTVTIPAGDLSHPFPVYIQSGLTGGVKPLGKFVVASVTGAVPTTVNTEIKDALNASNSDSAITAKTTSSGTFTYEYTGANPPTNPVSNGPYNNVANSIFTRFDHVQIGATDEYELTFEVNPVYNSADEEETNPNLKWPAGAGLSFENHQPEGLINWKIKDFGGIPLEPRNGEVFKGWVSELFDGSLNSPLFLNFTNCLSMFELPSNPDPLLPPPPPNLILPLEIDQWDTSKVTNMKSMFKNCTGLVNKDLSAWDVSKVTDMEDMFKFCIEFNSPLKGWNMIAITTMKAMFYGCVKFGGGQTGSDTLLNWTWGDTGTLIDTTDMFRECSLFNQELVDWNMKKIVHMERMFLQCTAFNANIQWIWDEVVPGSLQWTTGMFSECANFSGNNVHWAGWNMSGILEMPLMFKGTGNFQNSLDTWFWGPTGTPGTLRNTESMFEGVTSTSSNNISLDGWNMKAIIKMEKMFKDCTNFNGTLDWAWGNPSTLQGTLTTTANMFNGCTAFNQDLLNWNMKTITTMHKMFYNCNSFGDRDLNSWVFTPTEPGTLTDINEIFLGCTNFDGDLSSWNVSHVTDLSLVFENCKSFNKPLSTWNVGSATTMYAMFENCTSFDSALDNWDVSKVNFFKEMFINCTSFNQPLNTWDFGSTNNTATLMESMFEGCTVFNGSVATWNLSRITSFEKMFFNCKDFTQPTGTWTVGETTTTMKSMFEGCEDFNALVSTDGLPSPINWATRAVTDFSRMFFGCTSFNTVDALKQLSFRDATDVKSMFEGCIALENDIGLGSWSFISATGPVHLKSLERMFYNCKLFSISTISGFNVENIENFTATFSGCEKFGFGNVINLVAWDVSSAEKFNQMFMRCHVFNGNGLANWNTSNVTDMSSMFYQCQAFNEPLVWNTSSVIQMGSMFNQCSVFNQPLITNGNFWNVSSVTNFVNMFAICLVFDGDLSNWSLGNSNVRLSSMFDGAAGFTGIGLTTWENSGNNRTTANVTEMRSTFQGCKLFNADIDNWNVGNVNTMNSTFSGCEIFNKSLDWNTSSVTTMKTMFNGCIGFNSDLTFVTTNVTNMEDMFNSCTIFTGGNTGNINSWNVAKVTIMAEMFKATAFNQALTWNVALLANGDNMFDNSGMNTTNIDSTLTHWASLGSLHVGTNIGVLGVLITPGLAAVAALTGSPSNWTFTPTQP